jgi:hypothetical protein
MLMVLVSILYTLVIHLTQPSVTLAFAGSTESTAAPATLALATFYTYVGGRLCPSYGWC